MKRMLFVLFITCFTALSLTVMAREGQWQTNDKQEVRFVSANDEGVWRNGNEVLNRACNNPGEEVEVGQTKSFDRINFLHYMTIQQVVICDGVKWEQNERRGVPKFAWWIVLCFVAISFMMVSNTAMIKRNRGVSFVATAFTVAFTAFTVALTPPTFVAPPIFAIFTATLATLATNNRSVYWFFVVVFYVAMVVVLGYGWIF